MEKIKFGEWMRSKRQEKGLSAEELGKLAGVTKVSISRYENGHRIPNVDMVIKICKALGVDSINMDEFDMAESGEPEEKTEEGETA